MDMMTLLILVLACIILFFIFTNSSSNYVYNSKYFRNPWYWGNMYASDRSLYMTEGNRIPRYVYGTWDGPLLLDNDSTRMCIENCQNESSKFIRPDAYAKLCIASKCSSLW